MRLTQIHFKPTAAVIAGAEEVALLIECSEKHYDVACKQASQQGGFLFGMRNHAEHAPESPHMLTWRQLDTLAKIAEVGQYLEIEKGKRAFGLGLEIRRILIALDDATPEPKEITE